MPEHRQDQSEDILTRAIAATRELPMPAGPSADISAQTLAALRGAANRPQFTFYERVYHMPWTSKISALLATAAGLLVVYVGLSGFTASAPAFAAVLQTIRQAKSMVCDIVTTTSVEQGQLPEGFAQVPRRGTIAISFAREAPATLIRYEPSKSGAKSQMLFLADKAYVWEGEKVHVITSAEALQRAGAENWLGRLLEVRESPDRTLGEQTINGHRAVGFEVAGWKFGVGARPSQGSPTSTGSDARLRVWVDIEQNLPIRLEIEQRMVVPTATIKVHQLWDNIKWNVELNPADLRPPSAEVLATAETKRIPAIDETALVDFMRAWLESKDKAVAAIEMIKQKAQERGEELPADMRTLFETAAVDAGYPERLDAFWLSGRFAARATLASIGELLPKQQPIPAELDDAQRLKVIRERGKEGAIAAARASSDAMIKAHLAATFFQKLSSEQRNPEYFGATVKPGDTEAVLLQWKADDGRRRVIYGDLRAETVNSAD
jgi:hypothetical protein